MEKCAQCRKEKPAEQMLYLRARKCYVCNFHCENELRKAKPLLQSGFLFLGRLLALEQEKKPHLPDENT